MPKRIRLAVGYGFAHLSDMKEFINFSVDLSRESIRLLAATIRGDVRQMARRVGAVDCSEGQFEQEELDNFRNELLNSLERGRPEPYPAAPQGNEDLI